MATCSAVSSVLAGVPALSVERKVTLSSRPRVSFAGRNLCYKMSASSRSWEAQTSLARGNARTVCYANTSILISVSTGVMLFLGRFVFLPLQRSSVANAGLPEQNGSTHFEAGDERAQEVSSVLKTKDPAGFTLVDVLAWGALGHALGYFALAVANNGYDPTF